MDTSDFLTEDELLDFEDIKERELVIPEWGGKKVRIRGLTLQEMSTLATRASRPGPRGQPDIIDRELSILLTLQYGLVQPKISPENLPRLKQKSAGAVTRIVQAINDLGPTPENIDDATKSDAGQLNGAISILAGPGVEADEG